MLKNGIVALVDDEDFERVNQYKWTAYYANNEYRVMRKTKEGKTQYLHRFIMNAKENENIDHINHNPLDNKKANLRICTHAQNMRNQKKRRGSSNFKGVHWNKNAKKWMAQITCNYKKHYLGYFEKEENAAKVYDRVAKELFGEFALTNFETKDGE